MPQPTSAAPPGPLGGSWLASQGRLPLAFMGLGLAWFGAAAAMLLIWPELLAMPHFVPGAVALTHAWVLGFFVTVAVGAIYQLAPVALSTTLWSERAGWWHLALHAAALPVMIHAFWKWQMPLLGFAGSAMFAGITIFAVNTWVTIHRSGKRDAVAWSLTLATAWLFITVAAGLLLAANRAWALWPVDPLAILRAHAHLGLVGFFLTLLQGVAFRLIPMFTLGDVPDWRPVKLGLWLSQVGLLVLAPALTWHWGHLAAASGVAILLGMVASAYGLKLTLATRKKRVLDTGVHALVRGCVVLLVSAVAGIWLVLPDTSGSSAPGGFGASTYGILLLLGGLLPTIAGMMGKIVPFLTWMRAYGPKVGRVPTPPATAMSNRALESWALSLQAVAVLPLLAGAWLLNQPLLHGGAVILAIGTGLFAINMIGILKHLWKPVTLPKSTAKSPAP